MELRPLQSHEGATFGASSRQTCNLAGRGLGSVDVDTLGLLRVLATQHHLQKLLAKRTASSFTNALACFTYSHAREHTHTHIKDSHSLASWFTQNTFRPHLPLTSMTVRASLLLASSSCIIEATMTAPWILESLLCQTHGKAQLRCLTQKLQAPSFGMSAGLQRSDKRLHRRCAHDLPKVRT